MPALRLFSVGERSLMASFSIALVVPFSVVVLVTFHPRCIFLTPLAITAGHLC
ncbi:hypothetical protein BCR44DRAFT_1425263, partial [Catenaria anguillulae PL171]